MTRSTPDLATRTIYTIRQGNVRDEVNRAAGQMDGQPGGDVLLDFNHVEYVGSEDLGALVVLNKKVSGAGRRLTLLNVRPLVSDVLALTRLDTLLDVRRVA